MKLNEFISHLKHKNIKINIRRFYETDKGLLDAKTVYEGTVGTYLTSVIKSKIYDINISNITPEESNGFVIHLEGIDK